MTSKYFASLQGSISSLPLFVSRTCSSRFLTSANVKKGLIIKVGDYFVKCRISDSHITKKKITTDNKDISCYLINISTSTSITSIIYNWYLGLIT